MNDHLRGGPKRLHVALQTNGHGLAMKTGLERHGVQVTMTHGDGVIDAADIHICWSIKRPRVFAWRHNTQKPILVMERGHLQNRMEWTSLGWNGLGRHGTYALAPDGTRWNQYWGQALQPWNDAGGRVALVLGQCAGDASLRYLTEGFEPWAQRHTTLLRSHGYAVIYRPHPGMVTRGDTFCPKGAERSAFAALADDLARVDLAVSYNSTAGVDAVLAGVPTVTCDAGSMAWEMTSHAVQDRVTPDRTAWAHALAWTSFSIEEISSGFAWEAVSQVMEIPVA